MPALTPARDRSVRFRFRIFGLAAAFAMSSVALGAPGGTARRKITGPVVVEPEEDTTTPLALPDAGLQSRMWSAPRDNYVPRANVLYARFTWKDWGRLGRKKIGHFKGWMARKRYIGLRMYCNTVGDLPQGVNVPAHNAGRRHSPLYWSPQYMKAHRAFVQAVGKAMAADPYLAYVDIGGVGNTGGEWLVYPDDRWGARPSFLNAGYSAENRDRMLWAVIRMYREAFPHVRLYLVAGDAEATLNQLSASSEDGRIEEFERGPGDGTVLRSSVLLDERVGNKWEPRLRTPLDFHSVLFLPDDHLGVTRNEIFRDNVLYWLLEDPGDSR